MTPGGESHDAHGRASWPALEEAWRLLAPECGSLARRLRERHARTVGLVPADDDVAVPGAAILLARALAGRGPRPVAVVDAHGTWRRGAAPVALPEAGEHAATCWLRDDIALLIARPGARSALEQLRHTIEEGFASYEHLVLDLTGFDHAGDQFAACKLVDAVLLVARSGRTRTRRIHRKLRDLPASCLGVLLVGS